MSNDSRLAILETTILNINASLQDIRQDFKRLDNKLDSRFDALDRKFDSKIDALDKKFDNKFDLLQSRIWSNFLWLMGMIIGLAGLIAHTQHWL